MKNCLIYQPCGLGDIIWIQPILDRYINDGYKVHLPVIDLYYDMLATQLQKPNLIWYHESQNFPLKEFYGTHMTVNTETDIYVPVSFANYYLKNCSIMASKYYYTNTPLSNWHKSFSLTRNEEREQKLINVYNINLKKPFTLLNMTYGTPPNHVVRSTPKIHTDNQVIEMSFEKDKKHQFNLFDWIGVIEKATEIHTVETSLCYLVDKYSKTDNIFMYEKRRDNERPTYYNLTNMVYRNVNWTYMI